MFFREPSKTGAVTDPASPDVIKENQEYIRKRRPINFTLPDLAADAEEVNDEDFKLNMPSSSGVIQKLPKRNCSKKITYDEGENSSNDDGNNESKTEANLNESAKNSNGEEIDSQ